MLTLVYVVTTIANEQINYIIFYINIIQTIIKYTFLNRFQYTSKIWKLKVLRFDVELLWYCQ